MFVISFYELTYIPYLLCNFSCTLLLSFFHFLFLHSFIYFFIVEFLHFDLLNEIILFFSHMGFLLPGEATCKQIFKIPLCNLVGRSIERPLKSPLVHKVMTAPTPAMIAPTPLISATHSLSLSRMEIKEIASRTRKELLGILKICDCELMNIHPP